MLIGKRLWLILIAIIAILFSAIGALYLLGWFHGHTNAVQTWHVGTPVNSMAFSPDSKQIAVGLNGGTIQLRNLSDGGIALTMSGPTSDQLAFAFSPDGQLLASGTYDFPSPIYLWRIRGKDSGKGSPLSSETYYAISLAFSPDGKTLAV